MSRSAPDGQNAGGIGGTLAIVCGGGAMPVQVARAAQGRNVPVFLIGVAGEADTSIEAFPHTYLRWGEVGRLFRLLKENNCHDVVVIGKVRRPSLRQVHFDLGALWSLPQFLGMLAGGDDKILSSIVSYFEKRGIRVHGAHEFLPHQVAGEGVLGAASPSKDQRRDAAHGFKVAGDMGIFDIGQALVIENGYVLAVEAAEGTDAMIARAGTLRRGTTGRSGMLVKRAKPQQELRVDMPTVGVATVEAAAAAGLAGIVLEAGCTLLSDPDGFIAAADKAGLFVLGLSAGHDAGQS